jgi:tetratricopeptide (TPR) repeat protein
VEELDAFDSNASEQSHPEVEGEEDEPFVAPRDGFHLSDLADFAVVQRSAKAAPAPAGAANAEEPAPPAAPPQDEAAESANGAVPRGWRLRDGETAQEADAGAARSADDDRFETDPEVVEARLEINDRLRRKRCDEAAALLQRLANDVGGRALAELALDAGDRCRSLGKGNAALSCYLAASRADPVHETPLLRLADICMDDHDIDLAVSYLERVTRLRRLRNDDKGALKLYRKIVTIAPYRDDILAMLMRAQASGRFED